MNTDDERREEYTKRAATAAVGMSRGSGDTAAKDIDAIIASGLENEDALNRSDLLNMLNGSVICSMFEPATDLNELRRENSIQFCWPLFASKDGRRRSDGHRRLVITAQFPFVKMVDARKDGSGDGDVEEIEHLNPITATAAEAGTAAGASQSILTKTFYSIESLNQLSATDNMPQPSQTFLSANRTVLSALQFLISSS